MLAIRVDGNSKIGSGHIMRCLAIAEAVKEIGESIIFISADNQGSELIQSKGFKQHILTTKWDNMELEIEMLLTYLHDEKITRLLIDSYQVTKRYIQRLRGKVNLLYMDDLGSEGLEVDGLINYNLYAPQIPYTEIYSKTGYTLPKLWLGSNYVPLRREFWNDGIDIQPQVRNILISTGGGDEYNIAGQILEQILQSSNIKWLDVKWHIICGSYNQNRNHLKRLQEKNGQIVIHENVTEMGKLMKLCDLAIAAGGTTMYELSAMGIPTICFSFVANQDKIQEKFHELLGYSGGKYLENKKHMTEDILNLVELLLNDQEKRRESSKRMKEISDGQGAIRIAKILIDTDTMVNAR